MAQLHTPKPNVLLFFRYGFRTPQDPGPTNNALAREMVARYGVLPTITAQNMSVAIVNAKNAIPEVRNIEYNVVRADGDTDMRPHLDTRHSNPVPLLDLQVSWREERSRARRMLPRDPGADTSLVRHSTLEFMAQALEIAEVAGWHHIQPVCVAPQARRINTIARSLYRIIQTIDSFDPNRNPSMPTFLPADGIDVAMDPQSVEPWTRGPKVTALYESALTTVTERSLVRDSFR